MPLQPSGEEEQVSSDMPLTAPSLAFSSYMSPFTPQNYGRPSSPLNPHSGSSSPLTSPTPATSYGSIHHLYPSPQADPSRPPRMTHRPFSLPSPSSSAGSSTSRYGKRPTAPSRQRTSLPPANQVDLFTEGTSPVQGQLWRDRLSRRMEERERRKRAREGELGRRRGQDRDGDVVQEEADRRAQEDDEEIFRRLMVLQRRKAQHAALVSHEVETGGSDPLLPDFWEDELYNLEAEERILMRHWEDEHNAPHQQQFRSPQSMPQQVPFSTPPARANFSLAGRQGLAGTYRESSVDAIDQEEDDWAAEAAAAAEAEREAEEAEVLDRVEREYGYTGASSREREDEGTMNMDMDMDVDWDELDKMDME